jgi:peroxiredoxin-like protein
MFIMAESKGNLEIVWEGGMTGKGTLKADDGLHTDVAIPEALGGSGDGTNPKELLVASAASCFTLTLTSLLNNRKLPVADYTVSTEHVTAGDDTKIKHHPKIVLSAGATDDQVQAAHKAMEGADRACAVGNLLKKAGITIEYEGEVAVE